MSTIVPVILAGGGGTRLWPLSRDDHPKQFLPLLSERSLFIDTILRLWKTEGFAAPLVTCGAHHRFRVAAELEEAGVAPTAILTEPAARNTAPAAAAAAFLASELFGPDVVLALLPADHFIGDGKALRSALRAAADGAGAKNGGHIVAFGVRPQNPDTGYGYIEIGDHIAGTKIHRIARFVEKPDAETARQFLATDRFLWNAGMFVVPAGVLVEEMQRHCPKVWSAARTALEKTQRDPDFVRLDDTAFSASPAISLDYAVMEKTKRGAVMPVDLDWSDVGNWHALWEKREKDAAGNAVSGDVILADCRDSLVQSDSGLVAALGLENILIVQTDDATLVVPMARAQDVRTIVEGLKTLKRREGVALRRGRRPWGYFVSLHVGPGHQVKHLVLKPGAAISLQYHHHRSEHWTVVKGRARVTTNDDVRALGPNESAYIPRGAHHRLENTGDDELHVIEVQLGDYLGEDDIVRLEDKYKRV